MTLLVGAAFGLLLSLAGFGALWAGQPLFNFYVCAGFAILAFIVCRLGGPQATLIAVGAGALPLAMLITQFRDAGDSHLMPIGYALFWYLAMAVGAFSAARTHAGLVRCLLSLIVIALLHAGATMAPLLLTLGDAFRSIESAAPAATALYDRLFLVMLEPALSIWSGANLRGERLLQWLLLALNSLAWSAAVLLLLCWCRPPRRADRSRRAAQAPSTHAPAGLVRHR